MKTSVTGNEVDVQFVRLPSAAMIATLKRHGFTRSRGRPQFWFGGPQSALDDLRAIAQATDEVWHPTTKMTRVPTTPISP